MRHKFIPIFLCAVCALIATTANAEKLPLSDLIVHYTMDDPFDGTTFTDAGPNANDATTIAGTAWTSSGGAMFGDAVYLNYACASIGSTATMPGTGDDFTVAFWAKIDNWPNRDMIFASQNVNGVGYSIGLHNASDGMIIRSTFGSAQTGGINLSSLTSGTFNHFAIVFDDANGIETIYLNGDPMTSTIANGWGVGDAGYATLAGRYQGGADNKIQGVMDDFAIFNGKLNESTIEDIISGGVASVIVPEPGTIALLLGAFLALGLICRRGKK